MIIFRCDGCRAELETERLPEGWRMGVRQRREPTGRLVYDRLTHWCEKCPAPDRTEIVPAKRKP